MSAEEFAKLKSEQVKQSFIRAAKEMVLNEGITNLSVRKIAKETGYSYATIYHYFSDLNALLFAVKEELIRDMVASLMTEETGSYQTVDDLKRANRAYAQYYLDRPNVYQFFYAYRFENEPSPNYDDQFQDSWSLAYAAFVEQGLLRQEEVRVAAKTMIYTLHGLLALYFSSNGLSKESFYRDLDDATDYLFDSGR